MQSTCFTNFHILLNFLVALVAIIFDQFFEFSYSPRKLFQFFQFQTNLTSPMLTFQELKIPLPLSHKWLILWCVSTVRRCQSNFATWKKTDGQKFQSLLLYIGKARYVQKRTSVMATSINNMSRYVMSTSVKEERWYRKLSSDFFQIFWAKYQLHVYITVQKMKFSMKDFFTFTEEIVNGNFYFLCSVNQLIDFTSSSDFYN